MRYRKRRRGQVLLRVRDLARRHHDGIEEGRFERQGRRVDVARCLIDIAYVERHSGGDPTPILERARTLLEECGAKIHLSEIDAVMKDDA